jgi:hypothetical protein
MRGNAHVRFGGRERADHRAQARHGGSLPTHHRNRPAHQPQRQALALRRHVPALDRRRHAPRRQQFRRIVGYRDLAKLVIAIERHATVDANDQARYRTASP